ncbi:MAG: hypothetical protein AAFV62_04940 [Pseudomonadota bacterium]
MTGTETRLLQISAVLWVIWGLVHVLAGVIVLSSDATGAVQAVADGVDPAALVADYPAAAGGILNQHGWNLAWFGLATIIGAVFIWRGNLTAIWVTGMVGGLADVGYLLFVDLPGYVNFVPGTVMTFISGAAVVLSFSVWLRRRGTQVAT